MLPDVFFTKENYRSAIEMIPALEGNQEKGEVLPSLRVSDPISTFLSEWLSWRCRLRLVLQSKAQK